RAPRAGGGAIGARRALALLAPWAQSEPDLRGWEWHYLRSLYHRELLTWQSPARRVCDLRWAPDGTRVATADADGCVRIWAPTSDQPARVFRGHRGAVLAVDWSPDGRWLASGGVDGTLRVWDSSGGGVCHVRAHGG